MLGRSPPAIPPFWYPWGQGDPRGSIVNVAFAGEMLDEIRADATPGNMPDVEPENMPDAQPNNMPDAQPENMPDAQPDNMPDAKPENMPD